VDELDRCRPPFAVALLERVKHLFAVPGVVFVLGVHVTQLGNAVRALYGTGIDAEGYLRRIIDLTFTLPSPDADAFSRHLIASYDITEVVDAYGKPVGGDEPSEELRAHFAGLVGAAGLTLRDQAACFFQLNYLLRSLDSSRRVEVGFAVLLVLLRHRWRKVYDRVRWSGSRTREVLDALRSDNDAGEAVVGYLSSLEGTTAFASILRVLETDQELDEYRSSWSHPIGGHTNSQQEEQRLFKIRKIFSQGGASPGVRQEYTELLEFTSQLS
jgi:hypothetical protein